MNILEKAFLGTFISSLVFLLLGLTFLVLIIIKKYEITNIEQIKTKSKSKKRKHKKKLMSLRAQKKKFFFTFIVFIILSLATGGGTYYISYYQAINLSQKDGDLVVKGYYLLSDFENQLKKIESGDVDEKKAVQNIQNLGGAMASYNSVKASSVNKEEGQLKLNRYYNILKEIGSNAIPQSQKFFNNKDLINEFLADIKKAENYQEAVFDFYKVDRESLKKNE